MFKVDALEKLSAYRLRYSSLDSVAVVDSDGSALDMSAGSVGSSIGEGAAGAAFDSVGIGDRVTADRGIDSGAAIAVGAVRCVAANGVASIAAGDRAVIGDRSTADRSIDSGAAIAGRAVRRLTATGGASSTAGDRAVVSYRRSGVHQDAVAASGAVAASVASAATGTRSPTSTAGAAFYRIAGVTG